jgi:DNA polymerase elongation subunit (family B)
MPNQRVITIDIETLPAAEPSDCFLTEKDKTSGAKIQEAHRKTALNGDFGRLLCIGYSDERPGEPVTEGLIGWDSDGERLHADEALMLEEFWRTMAGFNARRDIIVGHNIFDFDLRFIIKRSIINRVRPTVALSFAKYRSQPIFDTMCEWECWSYGNRISLDKLAFALSLPSSKSDDVNGSRVFDLYLAGRHEEIRDYCVRDVRLTREVFKRMTFAAGQENRERQETDKVLAVNLIQ